MTKPEDLLTGFLEASKELTDTVEQIELAVAESSEAAAPAPSHSQAAVLAAIAEVEAKLESLQRLLDSSAATSKN